MVTENLLSFGVLKFRGHQTTSSLQSMLLSLSLVGVSQIGGSSSDDHLPRSTRYRYCKQTNKLAFLLCLYSLGPCTVSTALSMCS